MNAPEEDGVMLGRRFARLVLTLRWHFRQEFILLVPLCMSAGCRLIASVSFVNSRVYDGMRRLCLRQRHPYGSGDPGGRKLAYSAARTLGIDT